MANLPLNEQLKSYLISLFECNTDAILFLNIDGYILDVNPAFTELSGYSKDEIINREFTDFIIHEHKDLSVDDINIFDMRFRLITKECKQISCLMRLNHVKENESTIGLFLTMKNMSELDKVAEHYLESELHYRRIAENIQDVLILMDRDRNYLYMSPSSKKMFGFDYMNLKNQKGFFYTHPDYVEELTENFYAAIEKNESFKLKIKVYHKDHQWVWAEVQGKAVRSREGQFSHVLLVVRDISKQHEQEETLRRFAYHDALTNLPNRRMFREYIDIAFKRLNENSIPFAILLLDIDNFKQINDSYGHEIGDKVIIEYGLRLQQVIGEQGIVARLGGDEFVVLLTDFKNEEQVKEIAYQINERVRQEVLIQQMNLEITTSIGISICDNITFTASEVLRYADKALYNIKKQGKGTFSIYKMEEEGAPKE